MDEEDRMASRSRSRSQDRLASNKKHVQPSPTALSKKSGKKLISTFGPEETYKILHEQEEIDRLNNFIDSKYTGLTAFQGVLVGREDSPLRKKHILENLSKIDAESQQTRGHRKAPKGSHSPLSYIDQLQYQHAPDSGRASRNEESRSQSPSKRAYADAPQYDHEIERNRYRNQQSQIEIDGFNSIDPRDGSPVAKIKKAKTQWAEQINNG